MASLSTFDAFKHLYNAGGYHELSDADLEGLQAVLTDMMHDIHEVCKRRSVAYVLLAGSCLGAVRHKGFIPWDDDLDIGMTHADFDRFRSVFDEELAMTFELPGNAACTSTFSFGNRFRITRFSELFTDSVRLPLGLGIRAGVSHGSASCINRWLLVMRALPGCSRSRTVSVKRFPLRVWTHGPTLGISGIPW